MFKLGFILLIVLSSCSYHVGTGLAHKTICIPYADKDDKGRFTNELIYYISAHPSFSYVENEADYTLDVELAKTSRQTIGYKRDRLKTNGQFKKNVRETEARRKVKAQITLIDNKTQKIIIDKEEVLAFSDFDYVDGDSLQDLSFINQTGARDTVLRVSLGQLEESFSAGEAALNPLYQELSKKIISVLSKCCHDNQ